MMSKPQWANWKAMDEDGDWFWYEKKPDSCRFTGGWNTKCHQHKVVSINDHHKVDVHWLDTLAYVGVGIQAEIGFSLEQMNALKGYVRDCYNLDAEDKLDELFLIKE